MFEWKMTYDALAGKTNEVFCNRKKRDTNKVFKARAFWTAY